MKFIPAFLLAANSLISFFPSLSWAADKNPPLQLFADYEKPSLSKAVTPLPDFYLARGEWAGFSLRIKEAGTEAPASLQDLKFVPSDKSDPSVKMEIAAFYLAGHSLKTGSFKKKAPAFVEDIAFPNDLLLRPGFHFPAANKSAQPTYLIEFQLQGGKAKTALNWDGKITFTWKKKTYEIPVAGHLSQLELGPQFAMETSFGFSPSAVIKRHAPQWDQKSFAIYRDYLNMALDHRLDLHKFYLEFPTTEAPQAEKDILAVAKLPENSFRSVWQSLTAQDRKVSMQDTDLPVPEVMKNVVNPQIDPQQIEKFWKMLDASVVAHQDEKRLFVYFVDEPPTAQIESLKKNLTQIHQWAPHLRFLITSPYQESLKDLVQIWCENLFSWGQPNMKPPAFYDKLRAQKKSELWFYVSCNAHGCTGAEDHSSPDLALDRPTAYHLAFPWMAYRYHADGILYYDTVYGYTQSAESPWQDPFAFTGAGEGNLFYPCTEQLCGVNTPVASLRLKILRKALQDVEILRLAQQNHVPVNSWVEALIPSATDFPTAALDYENIKVKALKAWDKN